MKVIVPILLAYLYFKDVTSLDCYWNKENKYKYFASKTPYEIVRGDIRDSVIKKKECEPISLWVYTRHGQRNPGQAFSKMMEEALVFKQRLISSYERGNSTLCAQDIRNFKKWSPRNSLFTEPNKLTSEGFEELVGIAERLKETYPELLNELRNGDYLIHPVLGSRMIGSARGFITGLGNQGLTFKDPTPEYDSVAPYITCEKYQKDVRFNPDIYGEIEKYIKTRDFLNTKEGIERRLGISTLKNNDIKSLYDLCRFSWEGIANKPSPWCAIFTEEDMKVLEYIADMRLYYRNSYGSKYSAIFGEIAWVDLLMTFEKAKNRKGKKITVNFGHATMMNMLLVALDLFKDDSPLTGAHRDMARKWRTTMLSPFAANIIVVLNRCEKPGNGYEHSIEFYLNEKPLLEICNNGVCSWQEFENRFKPFLNATPAFCKY